MSSNQMISATKTTTGTPDELYKFLAAFDQTGRIDYIAKSDGSYHHPGIEDQIRLYLIGYKLRMESLMNSVAVHVYNNETASYIPMVAKIWEDTYPMCAEMRLECNLRHCLLDKFLHEVSVSHNMKKEDFEDTAIYPAAFQKAFFGRLQRLGENKYYLRNLFMSFKFDAKFKKQIKSWNPQQLHDRVIQKLELKRLSTSGQGGEFRDPEQRALESYLEAFPLGCLLINTSPEKWLCGLDAISKSIKSQRCTIPYPTVSQLEQIVASAEFQTAAGAFLVENNEVNRNLFTADQLAKILQIWGERYGEVLQLGWMTNEGLPHLFPCPDEDKATVIWIHNDDAEAEFANIMVMGHWSALEGFGV